VDEKAFENHKQYRHNIYDYIFFLAYVQEKPKLEYTGLESFVQEKYEEGNNQWFPIYKVGSGGNMHNDSDSEGGAGSDHSEGAGGHGGGDFGELVEIIRDVREKVNELYDEKMAVDDEDEDGELRQTVRGGKNIQNDLLSKGNSKK